MSNSTSLTSTRKSTGTFVSETSSFTTSPSIDSEDSTSFTQSVTSSSPDAFTSSVSAFTQDSFAPSTVLPALTPSPPPVTTSVGPISTSLATHSGQNSTQPDPSQTSQPQHLNTRIAAISVSVSLAALCLIGLAICLVLRRRRSHPSRRNGAPSQNVDADTLEKYAGASEYAYSKYQQGSAETRGTLPLLKASFDTRSRRSSRSGLSGEFGQYRYADGPVSPFLHEESEATHTPMAHAVPLADATPYKQTAAEGQFESVDLIPRSQSTTPRAATHALPPLVIPENGPTAWRSTSGKRMSRRSSRHTYRAVDAGDMSDVDSESMYSQASAYSTQSAMEPHDNYVSTMHDFSFATIPGTPHSLENKRDSDSTIRPHDSQRTSIATQQLSFVSETPLTEDEGALNEDAVLVATLLQSRGKLAQPPTRSESIISHIERKGSIRPAYRAESGDETGRQKIRSLRVLRKAHGSSSEAGRAGDAP